MKWQITDVLGYQGTLSEPVDEIPTQDFYPVNTPTAEDDDIPF